MTFEIIIEPKIDVPDTTLTLLENAAAVTLNHQGLQDHAAVTILLSDDTTLQALNKEFLGEDRPTDVLSFPAGDTLPGMGDFTNYLGDIALSVPYATRQAMAKGHDPAAEMQLLVVHGLLHLIGYDHYTSAEQQRMWRVQAEILERLGLGAIAPNDESDE
jgi:probable rRNA maturation factor